jgi:phenylacetate-CoA ligase
MILGKIVQTGFSKYLAWPLLDFQQAVRPARRESVLTFRNGLSFRAQSETWPSAAKENWVLQRLRFVVREAVCNTRYYSNLRPKLAFDPLGNFTFDDFASFPVLNRSDVIDGVDDMILDSANRVRLRKDATGGSTGEPVSVWIGPNEDIWHSSAREYFMRRVGVPRGSRIALLWGHHLDPVQQSTPLQRLYSFINNERWFDCFRLSDSVLNDFHLELQDFRPDCIIAYASALAALAEYLSRAGLKPKYPRICTVTGAEKLFDFQRAIAEKIFRKPIYERYGSREVGMMAYQIYPPGFLVDWANLYVEPETNDPESTILVTKLQGDGMPMIRYKTGDLGSFFPESKPGHPCFALKSIIGRSADRISLPDGNFINSLQFPHMLKDFPVRDFQVEQCEDYSIHVRLVPRPEFQDGHKDLIASLIRKNLPNIPLIISTVDAIPKTAANKLRPVVSRVSRQIHPS